MKLLQSLVFVSTLLSLSVKAAQPTVGGRTVVLATSGTITTPTIDGGTITHQTNLDLTVSRVMVSSPVGVPTNSAVTTTILGYLDATSSIQTQLNAKAPLVSPSFTTPALGVATATSINGAAVPLSFFQTLSFTGNTNITLDCKSYGASGSTNTIVYALVSLTTNAYITAINMPSNNLPSFTTNFVQWQITFKQDSTGGRAVNVDTNVFRFQGGYFGGVTTNANAVSVWSGSQSAHGTNLLVFEANNFLTTTNTY